MANIVTSSRIALSILMLFFSTENPLFYMLYVFCGISDIADGYIARKTNSASEFGARLDSIADFIFVIAAIIKILPAIHLSVYIWIWIGLIALIKAVNIVSGFIYQKRLVMLHTAANKLTGLLLFITPLILLRFPARFIFIPACTAATFSAIQEGHFIRTGKI